MTYRVEWWTQHSGSLKTQRATRRETAEYMFKEKSENPEVVEVRVIEETMILQHVNGNGSCGDINL